jgi:hypothetical protein
MRLRSGFPKFDLPHRQRSRFALKPRRSRAKFSSSKADIRGNAAFLSDGAPSETKMPGLV